jgi:lipoate-protein ligase B
MDGNGFKPLYRLDLGKTNYKETWDLQKKLVDLRSQDKIADTLILTEHEPVITMGRGTAQKNLLVSRPELEKRGIELYQIERGGDITYHGPGQIVAYPIIDLNARGRDLHRYLRDLEETIMQTLDRYGLTGTLKKGMTGVWVDNHKLAAIGVAVSRWVSYHGLALNVNTDLDYAKLINPCGITQFPVGSISSMLNKKIDFEEVKNYLADDFAEYFGYEIKDAGNMGGFYQEPAVA